MPRTRRTTVIVTTVALVALLALLAGGPTGHRAAAAPLAPAGLPPTNVPWFQIGLGGGPVYQLSVSLGTKGGQRVVAAGNEVFVSARGTAWLKTRDRTGPVVNLVAGPDGALYAAAAGGAAFRSSDYGRNWYATRLRGDAPARFLAVSPDFPTDKLAFGITREDWRLYRADKGGTSWNEVIVEADASPRYQFGAVAFSPLYATDETFFVGSDRGIFKTTSAGLTWERQSAPADGAPAFGAAGGPPEGQGLVTTLDYGDDPSRRYDVDDRTLFAYNSAGLFRSDDDGVTWRRLDLNVARINGLAVSNGWPTDRALLAAVADPGGAVGAVSLDGGDSWRLIQGEDGLAGTSAALAFDYAYVPPEVDPNRRWVYLPALLKGAELEEIITGLRPRPKKVGSREMYLATDGDGVWRSNDAGRSWDRQSAGLANVQVTDLLFLPGGPYAHVLAGTENAGLFRSINAGRTWRRVAAGLPRGAGQAIHALRLAPGHDRDPAVYMAADSGLWVSRNEGISWAPLTDEGPQPARTLAISPAFARDRTMLSAGYISTDGGTSWTPLPGQGEWAAVTFSPNFEQDRTIWAAGFLPPEGVGFMLRRSGDGGQTWEAVEHTLFRNRPVWALAVVSVTSAEANRVFVGTDRGLIASHDNGSTWQRISEMGRDSRAIVSRTLMDPDVGMTAIVVSTGQDGAIWSVNRGIDWITKPAAPDLGRAAAISPDGSVLLLSVPAAVARLGEGSVWTFVPVARQRN